MLPCGLSPPSACSSFFRLGHSLQAVADGWLVRGNVNSLTAFNNDMAAILKAPVYPAIGNHEASPANLFPRTTSNAVKDFQWIFDTQSAGWSVCPFLLWALTGR